MFVIGYKVFNGDFTNRAGFKFKVGETYHIKGTLKWGNQGNGFHLCTNFEDCFKYISTNNLY